MIHHDLKFVFVHINKCGGNAIEDLLGRISGLRKRKVGNHRDIFDYFRALSAEQFRSYFKIAIVRNPWDRMVSEYVFQRDRVCRGDDSPDLYRMLGPKLDATFEKFLHLRPPRWKTNQLDWLAQPAWVWDDKQSDWAERSDTLDILVDYIGRFEDIEAAARRICLFFGVPFPQLRVRNRGPARPHYRSFYTDRTRDLVAKMHERDINYFGYDF